MQVPGFQCHPGRQACHLSIEYVGRHWDFHARCRPMPMELIDDRLQTFFSPALLLKFFSIGQAPQVIDQQMPFDQKCPARLVAAEAVQQLDRLPAS